MSDPAEIASSLAQFLSVTAPDATEDETKIIEGSFYAGVAITLVLLRRPAGVSEREYAARYASILAEMQGYVDAQQRAVS